MLCGVVWVMWMCWGVCGGRVVDEEYSMGLNIILAGQYHILFA